LAFASLEVFASIAANGLFSKGYMYLCSFIPGLIRGDCASDPGRQAVAVGLQNNTQHLLREKPEVHCRENTSIQLPILLKNHMAMII